MIWPQPMLAGSDELVQKHNHCINGIQYFVPPMSISMYLTTVCGVAGPVLVFFVVVVTLVPAAPFPNPVVFPNPTIEPDIVGVAPLTLTYPLNWVFGNPFVPPAGSMNWLHIT